MEALKQSFESQGLFDASLAYYSFKLVFNLSILGLSVCILHFYHDYMIGILSSAFLLALFWQQCGWLAHDFVSAF